MKITNKSTGRYQMNKAAQALGRLAKGKPKNYSSAELARRKKRLAEVRLKRWPAMVPKCEYYGPDFSLAQNRAKNSNGLIWEEENRRGYFLVLTEAQNRKHYPDLSGWSCY